VRQRASYEYHDADGKTIKTMEHRAGWDATFSAPNSVSLTSIVGGGNHPPVTTGEFIATRIENCGPRIQSPATNRLPCE